MDSEPGNLTSSKGKVQSRSPSQLQLKLVHLFCFLLSVISLSLGMFAVYLTTFSFLAINIPSPVLIMPLIPSLPDHHNRLSEQKNMLFPSRIIQPSALWNTDRHPHQESVPVVKERVSRMHNMTDEELLKRAVLVQGREFSDGIASPKVAFLFLSSGPLHLSPVWEKFFGGNEGLYTIYWHARPSYNDYMSKDSVFYGTRIPSQEVKWGTSSMMDAEKRLIANALLDPANLRFVILSESCIPLFEFKTIYNYLVKSNHSFQASFDHPSKNARGRYHPGMAPTINVTDWRKGSQWFELHRDHARLVVSDRKYYAPFQELCRPPCYVDEHYIPTLLNIMDERGGNSNRSVTWVDWSRDGPHPGKFGWDDMTDEFLDNIRFGSNCSYNGEETRMCFLFARKFLPSALEQLLRILPVLLGLDP